MRCLMCALTIAAAPVQVMLHLDGSHPVGQDNHQGTFTASAPLCSSGSWAGNAGGTRLFTCADGSGTFLVSFNGNLEHVAGSTGDWAIQSGTGSYATLRGGGTARVDSSTGPTSVPVVFSDTFTGAVAFDVTPPSGSITSVKFTRPKTARGRWRASVFFATQDDDASNPVSYQADATIGAVAVEASGTVTTGTASFSFLFRRQRGARVLEIELRLSDPVDNQRVVTRTVRLPRP
jgi:hypothetical protein